MFQWWDIFNFGSAGAEERSCYQFRLDPNGHHDRSSSAVRRLTQLSGCLPSVGLFTRIDATSMRSEPVQLDSSTKQFLFRFPNVDSAGVFPRASSNIQ